MFWKEGNDDNTKSKNDSVVPDAVLDLKNNTTNEVGDKVANTNGNKQNTLNNFVNSSQPQVSNVRENLVSKATEFLVALPSQNNYSMEKKYQFLRSKGLTDQEIQASFLRASAICNNKNLYKNSPPQVSSNFSSAFGAIQTPVQSESWFIQLLRAIAFASSVTFVCYQIYKNYVEKWLFGKKTTELEKRLDVLEQSMQRCITLIEDKNISNSSDYVVQQHQIDQIRAELKSIKSLLLNRSQFPSAPSPGLPHWQVTKNIKPQVEQSSTVKSVEIPSTVQQKTVKSVESPIPPQPVKIESKSNGIETPSLTQPVKEKGAKTISLQKQSSPEKNVTD